MIVPPLTDQEWVTAPAGDVTVELKVLVVPVHTELEPVIAQVGFGTTVNVPDPLPMQPLASVTVTL